MSDLPAHSPLGASSAERWMACPGSTTLINALREGDPEFDTDDPDYRRDGVQAHALAAECLNAGIDAWEAPVENYPDLTAEMMAAVQVHLDYVRSLDGQRFVEYKLHRPGFHEAMYGTVDAAVQGQRKGLHVIDYKHGVGVVVEVENNPQIMYYAFMLIDELGDFDDDEEVTLTIVQPRVTWHPDGGVRSWVSTVGHIRRWAGETLRPAMERTAVEGYLATGEHCRFCPAKLICSGFLQRANRALKLGDIKALTDDLLAELLHDVPLLKMALTALTAEAKKRTINEAKVLPGWKLVNAMADRIWKDTAPVADKFGFQPQKIKSPAQVEAEPGGKEFVAEWAFRPNAGYDLVPETDRRKAVVLEKSSETFKQAIESLKQ